VDSHLLQDLLAGAMVVVVWMKVFVVVVHNGNGLLVVVKTVAKGRSKARSKDRFFCAVYYEYYCSFRVLQHHSKRNERKGDRRWGVTRGKDDNS